MPPPPIECRSLARRFGDLAAVEDLSFAVEPGSVTGFVGHNGAGKTTTLRMLLGLARPTRGEAYLLGEPCDSADRSHLARVGYLPESPAFYGWMTPLDFLIFVGETLGMGHAGSRSRAAEVLDLFALPSRAARRIAGFSKGERQRLGLAQAMMGAPELLILDEPTSGLDPLGRHELLSLIGRMRGELTIFFSSHILEDVEKVCDRVVMIARGRLLEEGPLREVLRGHARPGFTVRLRAGGERLAAALRREGWAGEVWGTETAVRLDAADPRVAGRELPRLVADLGLSMTGLEGGGGGLEEAYLGLMEDAAHG